MRRTTAFDDNVFDINALLHPGTIFDHPRMCWRIPRCPFQRNAPSWRPGHPTHRRSLPLPRCGHRRASRHPSPSMKFLNPYASSTAAPAIPPAASRTACVQRRDSWRHREEQYHARNQIAATCCKSDRASMDRQIYADAGILATFRARPLAARPKLRSFRSSQVQRLLRGSLRPPRVEICLNGDNREGALP
jgi:hypothetical protein